MKYLLFAVLMLRLFQSGCAARWSICPTDYILTRDLIVGVEVSTVDPVHESDGSIGLADHVTFVVREVIKDTAGNGQFPVGAMLGVNVTSTRGETLAGMPRFEIGKELILMLNTRQQNFGYDPDCGVHYIGYANEIRSQVKACDRGKGEPGATDNPDNAQ